MIDLCRYKNIFGIPGEGIHSYRVYNIAIMDVIGTILIGLIISFLFDTPLIKTIILLFLLGCIMHYLFCVDTTVNKYLNQLLHKLQS